VKEKEGMEGTREMLQMPGRKEGKARSFFSDKGEKKGPMERKNMGKGKERQEKQPQSRKRFFKKKKKRCAGI